jgi:hypothetical protein
MANLIKVEYFNNSVKVGESTTPPFNFVWPIPSGSISLQCKGHYDNGQISDFSGAITGTGTSATPKATPAFVTDEIASYKTRVTNAGGVIEDEPWLGDEFYNFTQSTFDTYFNSLQSAAGGFKTGQIFGMSSDDSDYYDTLDAYIVTDLGGRPTFVCDRNSDFYFQTSANLKDANGYILRADFDYSVKDNYLTLKTDPSNTDNDLVVGIDNAGNLYTKQGANPSAIYGTSESNFFNAKIGLVVRDTTYDVYINGIKRITNVVKNDVELQYLHTQNPTLAQPTSTSFVGKLYSFINLHTEVPEATMNILTAKH